MQWNFEFDDAGGGSVRAAAFESFSPHRVIGFFSEMLNQSYWRPGTPLLVDFSRLNISELDSRDVQMLKYIMAAVRTRLGFGKLAIFCPDEKRFEFGCTFSGVAQPNVDREICVFQVEQKATEWLLSERQGRWRAEAMQRTSTFKDETTSEIPPS